MCYNNYGDNMKINIFDKALSLLLDKVSLVKPISQKDIIASYQVHMSEALTDTTYYYVRTKDGKEALYLCPGYKFIAGEKFLDKRTLESLPKKTYKNKQELVRNEPTEGLFYQLLSKRNESRTNKLYDNKYKDGFSYITSLYYGENDEYKEAYEELYKALKKECDNLGIIYETDPEKIIEQKLEEIYEKSELKVTDVRVCKSKKALIDYYEKNILSCTDSRKLSNEITNLQYIRSNFTMSYIGEFLTKSDNLITALQDRNYPNREEILKNYLEFLISKDLAFEIVKYIDELISKADLVQVQMDKERYNNNIKFMEDLETITNHNPEDETYCYHATTSLEDAKRIIEEGFYSYSKDLGSTSFPEFTVDQILTYSYGNGIENFGDYIIVLSVPKGEDIVEELTEEEQEKVQIIPRRNACIGNKPTHKVDKKHIVGLIDKKHEKVIFNKEYLNNSKKQINM